MNTAHTKKNCFFSKTVCCFYSQWYSLNQTASPHSVQYRFSICTPCYLRSKPLSKAKILRVRKPSKPFELFFKSVQKSSSRPLCLVWKIRVNWCACIYLAIVTQFLCASTPGKVEIGDEYVTCGGRIDKEISTHMFICHNIGVMSNFFYGPKAKPKIPCLSRWWYTVSTFLWISASFGNNLEFITNHKKFLELTHKIDN